MNEDQICALMVLADAMAKAEAKRYFEEDQGWSEKRLAAYTVHASAKRIALESALRAMPEPIDFDMWMASPYTKVLEKSIKEDYVPRGSSQALAPLTSEQLWANNDLMAVNATAGILFEQIVRFARAIERAHGIGTEVKQ